jgi:hypothetical protein
MLSQQARAVSACIRGRSPKRSLSRLLAERFPRSILYASPLATSLSQSQCCTGLIRVWPGVIIIYGPIVQVYCAKLEAPADHTRCAMSFICILSRPRFNAKMDRVC